MKYCAIHIKMIQLEGVQRYVYNKYNRIVVQRKGSLLSWNDSRLEELQKINRTTMVISKSCEVAVIMATVVTNMYIYSCQNDTNFFWTVCNSTFYCEIFYIFKCSWNRIFCSMLQVMILQKFNNLSPIKLPKEKTIQNFQS